MVRIVLVVRVLLVVRVVLAEVMTTIGVIIGILIQKVYLIWTILLQLQVDQSIVYLIWVMRQVLVQVNMVMKIVLLMI